MPPWVPVTVGVIVGDIDPAWQTGPVPVTLSASDGVLSGVDQTYYRLDGGAWSTESMSLADGLYTATIPGQLGQPCQLVNR